jgi:hypothetical protein
MSHPHLKSGASATFIPYHPETTVRVVSWEKTFCWKHETYHGNYGWEQYVCGGPDHEKFMLEQEGRKDEVS